MRRFSTYLILALVVVFGTALITPADSQPDDNGSGQGQPPAGSPPVVQPAPPAPTEKKAENEKEKLVPKYIEAEIKVTYKTFVADETVVLDGAIVFDYVFNVHWDELSPERLKLGPFRVVKVVVGPQRPAYSQGKGLFADYRPVQIILALEDRTRRGVIQIPAFRLGYSWQEGEKTTQKGINIGPWTVERVPIKISASLSSKVLHLGEQAEVVVRITREKDVKILNQFIGTLKDEGAGEVEKTEIRRWLKSLEVRKESAFNLEAPDFKPMRLLEKSVEEVERAESRVSVYTYTVAYYEEANKTASIPAIKVWYTTTGRTVDEYQEPKSVGVNPIEVGIASRILGKDRRLDGPQSPRSKRYGTIASNFFSFGLPSLGFVAAASGTMLLIGRRKKSVAKPKEKARPLSFKKASHELTLFLNPVCHGGNLSPRAVVMLRERVFAVIGAVLGLTEKEARASSADELAASLEKRFARAHIEPVLELLAWCDNALSLSDASSIDGVELSRAMLERVKPFLRERWLWDALAQI